MPPPLSEPLLEIDQETVFAVPVCSYQTTIFKQCCLSLCRQYRYHHDHSRSCPDSQFSGKMITHASADAGGREPDVLAIIMLTHIDRTTPVRRVRRLHRNQSLCQNSS